MCTYVCLCVGVCERGRGLGERTRKKPQLRENIVRVQVNHVTGASGLQHDAAAAAEVGQVPGDMMCLCEWQYVGVSMCGVVCVEVSLARCRRRR